MAYMDRPEIEAYLRSYLVRVHTPEKYAEVKAQLAELKSAAILAEDENEANHLCKLQEVLRVQARYEECFALIKEQRFYKAWCELEKAEITLNWLSKHLAEQEYRNYGLRFIEDHVSRWQSLYPYAVFLSPGFIARKKRCGICQAEVGLRSKCEHEVGEIYWGEVCCREIVEADMVEVSFVTNPVQKYSVPFTSEMKDGEPIHDHYNYAMVQYTADCLRDPYHGWKTKETTRLHSHDKFAHLGRNSPCPCKSGLKYKRCCLHRGGITLPHLDVEFEVTPSPGATRERLI